MKKIIYFIISGLLICCSIVSGQVVQNRRIDISGNWAFAIDSLDAGVKNKWFNNKLPETIHLPGSMTTNGKGNDVTLHTPWTGGVWNAQWYKDSSYAKYRQPGNIKVSFWLQPVKYYVGAAWYQKEVVIPREWSGQHIELFLERCHWETMLWIDGKRAGMQNALSAPHIYQLDNLLKPGIHTITLRIDNRIKDINPGADAHSVSDNTQTNWNGVIGEMALTARPAVYLSSVQLFPDVDKKRVVVKVTGKQGSCKFTNPAASGYCRQGFNNSVFYLSDGSTPVVVG
jgi:hypothetical protein